MTVFYEEKIMEKTADEIQKERIAQIEEKATHFENNPRRACAIFRARTA